MRKNRWKFGLSVLVVTGLSVSVACNAEVNGSVQAEQTEMTLTDENSETEFPEVKEDPEFIIVELDGDEELTVQNESGVEIEEVEVKEEEKVAETEAAGEEETTQTKETLAVILVSNDGSEHLFEDFPENPTNPELISDDGFLFLKYKGEDGNYVYAYETADEVTFEKPKTKYITDRVYIRSEPNQDSEILGVAELGSEVKVLGAQPKWCLVEVDGVKGYVGRPRISPDKDDAENAVAQEEAARAEIAAAAARAAAQAARAGASGGGNSVVSRQWVEDCDGSGNGYYIVRHSNGSVTYEDG